MSVEGGKSYQVMIVAGEASGDLHGSNLIRAAAEHYPQLHFFGVGGEKMRAAGCRIIFPSDELSVMGMVEVLSQLPKITRRFRQLKSLFDSDQRPDLLILIDFPDFNLRLAKAAKIAGIPVLYYISPKVWAWRKSRAKVIAERVDRLALIFPFEVDIYQPLGVQAEYVGNPLLDEFSANQPENVLRQQLAIDEQTEVVGIFPGSRNSEIRYIFDPLLETARQILQQRPAVRFILPVAPSLSRKLFEQKIAASGLPITIVDENIYEVAAACNVVLSVSGTVTLQLALTATPMVILYKVAPLSYAIGKRLISLEHVGLPNIVAGESVVKEFIQDDATPENLVVEVERILGDAGYRLSMKQKLTRVQQRMGTPGCSRRVAKMAFELLTAKVMQ